MQVKWKRRGKRRKWTRANLKRKFMRECVAREREELRVGKRQKNGEKHTHTHTHREDKGKIEEEFSEGGKVIRGRE